MTKSDLIRRLAKRLPHLTIPEAEQALNAILDDMKAALIHGGRIEIRGFGSFSVRKRNARIGHNPRNGDSIPISERCAIYFRAGKDMREAINSPFIKHVCFRK
jgi:integration host factor subunit beta